MLIRIKDTKRLKDKQFMRNKKQEKDNARKEERSNVGDHIDTLWYSITSEAQTKKSIALTR